MHRFICVVFLIFVFVLIGGCSNNNTIPEEESDVGKLLYIGDPPEGCFTTVWKTDNISSLDVETDPHSISFTLTNEGEYDFYVYWGDGSANHVVPYTRFSYDGQDEFWYSSLDPHIYSEPGTYTVSITGLIKYFEPGEPAKLVEISNWGPLVIGYGKEFEYCENLKITATDIPVIKENASMDHLFSNCSSLDIIHNLEQWNVSTVTNMEAMFSGTAINQDINGWDVSHVWNMSAMFFSAEQFNGNIGAWDVSNVTDMSGMFSSATNFNQDISNWNVWKVDDMSAMFALATNFNQDIGGWDVSKVTDMSWMLSAATMFDQDISDWDVSNVTTMEGMGSPKSTSNYDALLKGWSSLPTLQVNVVFNVGNYVKYSSSGAAGRHKLIDVYGWTITDGGQE